MEVISNLSSVTSTEVVGLNQKRPLAVLAKWPFSGIFGRNSRIRTYDLCLPKDTLGLFRRQAISPK